MYTPNLFKFENDNDNDKIAFIKQYSFATMITVKEDLPIATQLPFYINENSEKLTLCSHFALVNEQANYIENNTSLIIFSEPHAYISPIHYDKRESVPTWDYIAVHAYGKAKIISGEVEKIQALEQMIQYYEASYLSQWQSLSDRFKKGMMSGIVAFEIEVTDLQVQKKLSQNKTKIEKQRIVNHLENSENTIEKELANFIKNEEK